MLPLLTDKTVLPSKNSRLSTLWLIIGLFAVVVVLEYSTPPNYVFGYLYTGPILLANSRLSRAATFKTTIIAASLTMLNLWVPGGYPLRASTVASRAIAVLALIVTGVLSDRNRRYEEVSAMAAGFAFQDIFKNFLASGHRRKHYNHIKLKPACSSHSYKPANRLAFPFLT